MRYLCLYTYCAVFSVLNLSVCSTVSFAGPSDQRSFTICARKPKIDLVEFGRCMNLTQEQQIGLECVSADGIEILGVAWCIASTLSVRELQKCREEIGGHGCWGDNNDFRRVVVSIAKESVRLYESVPLSISGQWAADSLSQSKNLRCFPATKFHLILVQSGKIPVMPFTILRHYSTRQSIAQVKFGGGLVDFGAERNNIYPVCLGL
jgi:hypothetical protein